MRNRTAFWMIALLMALALSLTLGPVVAQESRGVLNIYSARHYGAMEQPMITFQEETGIEVRVSQGTDRDLLGRLQADIDRGGRSPADLFMSIDAGVLSLAAANDLLEPVESEVLTANIPESQRDPEGRWFGLSQRVRTVVYNVENVSEDELAALNDYADLADPTWEGRLCLRPASHIYTVSWASSLIHHLGAEGAREVIDGIVANSPVYINSDTSQIQAVAAGQCDVALVNHYYLGRLTDSSNPADQAVVEAVAIKWMNQDTTGVFYNITGAGVVRNAANLDNAIAFLEYFSTIEGQSGDPMLGLPGNNYEFPTNPEAEVNPIIAAFGAFTLDLDYPLWEYGALQADAVTLLEEAGFGFNES